MWWQKEWVIFWIGMIPMLVAYWPLKSSLSPYAFVAAAVLYLILLRIAANRIALRFGQPEQQEDHE